MVRVGLVAPRPERAVAVRDAPRVAALRSVRVLLADLPVGAVGVGGADGEREAGVGAALEAGRVLDHLAVGVARTGVHAEAALRIAGVASRAGTVARDAGFQREVAGLRGVAAVRVGVAE